MNIDSIQILRLLLYFIIYSFFGWVLESIFKSILQRKIVNSGLLYGPICPIYGFGAIIMLLFLNKFKYNLVLLFLAGFIVLSVWEYIVGALLEKKFNTKYWDYSNNEPMPRLMSELDNKVLSVENRIYSSTGIRITPIYYSALHRYNISKLLLTMMRNMPENKRFLLADSLNKNPDIWKKNDDIENYNTEIQKEVKLSITHALSGAAKGAMAGATVGSFIPVIGTAVGAAVGAALGFLGGLLGM